RGRSAGRRGRSRRRHSALAADPRRASPGSRHGTAEGGARGSRYRAAAHGSRYRTAAHGAAGRARRRGACARGATAPPHATATQPRPRKRPSSVSIGSNIVAREVNKSSKTWLLLLLVVLLGAGAAAFTVYWTRDDGLPIVAEPTKDDSNPQPKKVGTIRFMI